MIIFADVRPPTSAPELSSTLTADPSPVSLGPKKYQMSIFGQNFVEFWSTVFSRRLLPSSPHDNFCRLSALPHLLQNYHQLWPLIPAPFLLNLKNVPKLPWILADSDIFSCTISPRNRVQLVLSWQRRGDNLGPVTDADPLWTLSKKIYDFFGPWSTLKSPKKHT